MNPFVNDPYHRFTTRKQAGYFGDLWQGVQETAGEQWWNPVGWIAKGYDTAGRGSSLATEGFLEGDRSKVWEGTNQIGSGALQSVGTVAGGPLAGTAWKGIRGGARLLSGAAQTGLNAAKPLVQTGLNAAKPLVQTGARWTGSGLRAGGRSLEALPGITSRAAFNPASFLRAGGPLANRVLNKTMGEGNRINRFLQGWGTRAEGGPSVIDWGNALSKVTSPFTHPIKTWNALRHPLQHQLPQRALAEGGRTASRAWNKVKAIPGEAPAVIGSSLLGPANISFYMGAADRVGAREQAAGWNDKPISSAERSLLGILGNIPLLATRGILPGLVGEVAQEKLLDRSTRENSLSPEFLKQFPGAQGRQGVAETIAGQFAGSPYDSPAHELWARLFRSQPLTDISDVSNETYRRNGYTASERDKINQYLDRIDHSTAWRWGDQGRTRGEDPTAVRNERVRQLFTR